MLRKKLRRLSKSTVLFGEEGNQHVVDDSLRKRLQNTIVSRYDENDLQEVRQDLRLRKSRDQMQRTIYFKLRVSRMNTFFEEPLPGESRYGPDTLPDVRLTLIPIRDLDQE